MLIILPHTTTTTNKSFARMIVRTKTTRSCVVRIPCVFQLLVILLLLLLVLVLCVPMATAATNSTNSSTSNNHTLNNPNDLADVFRCPTEYTHNSPPEYAVIFPWVVEILGVVVFFLLKQFHIPVPFAACMFIIGAAMGAGACRSGSTDQLTISITQWSTINSEVLLLIFLPGLIFRDAIEVNFGLFSVSFFQILLLAFPMVLMGTAMIAVVGVYILPFDWDWSLAATLGAILSSTDPIAVASVLKTAGAPPRLQMHISGESLLNDGSAVVFYSVFSQIFFASIGVGEGVTWSEGIALFFRESLGGVAVGLAFAAALIGCMYELDRRLDREYDVLQVVAALSVSYISYYVADTVLAMSGIIAVVTVGITSAALGKGLINDEELMDSYLSLMEHLLNTLLFALGGAEWGRVIAGTKTVISGTDWGYLVLLYVLVVVIRFIQVAVFYPVFSRIGLKSDWREATFLAFGGLRGAVGIALADSLLRTTVQEANRPEDLLYAFELVFLSGGISLFTLSVNGTTAAPVLKLLGLATTDDFRDKARKLFELSAEDFVYHEYQRLLHEPRFRALNHRIVKYHVPYLKNDTILSQEAVDEIYRESTSTSRISLVNAEYDQTLKTASSTSVEAAVIEMRKVFLALLKEVYQAAILKGELDNKDGPGFGAEALKQGVDITYACCEKEPIHDWEYTEMFPIYTDARTFLWARFHPQKHDHAFRQSNAGDLYQLRKSVFRALSFIEAHMIAEKKLKRYVESTVSNSTVSGYVDASKKALEQVLRESGMQVAEAEKVLERVPPEIMEIFVSHFVSGYLLHRLSRFVRQNVDKEVLTPVEGQEYLEMIDGIVKDIQICKGSCMGEDKEEHDQRLGQSLESVVEGDHEDEEGDHK